MMTGIQSRIKGRFERRRRSYSDPTNRKWENEAGVCWEFGLVNSTIQTIWKTELKVLVRLNGMDRE